MKASWLLQLALIAQIHVFCNWLESFKPIVWGYHVGNRHEPSSMVQQISTSFAPNIVNFAELSIILCPKRWLLHSQIVRLDMPDVPPKLYQNHQRSKIFISRIAIVLAFCTIWCKKCDYAITISRAANCLVRHSPAPIWARRWGDGRLLCS